MMSSMTLILKETKLPVYTLTAQILCRLCGSDGTQKATAIRQVSRVGSIGFAREFEIKRMDRIHAGKERLFSGRMYDCMAKRG